jgi:hypothetical protein
MPGVVANEVLTKRAEQVAAAAAKAAEAEAREKEAAKAARSAPKTGGAAKKTTRARSSRTTAIERQSGRVASGVFNTIARELMRGILGTPKRRR